MYRPSLLHMTSVRFLSFFPDLGNALGCSHRNEKGHRVPAEKRNHMTLPLGRHALFTLMSAAFLTPAADAQVVHGSRGKTLVTPPGMTDASSSGGPGSVLSQWKISATEGNFVGNIEGDTFGTSVATIGDLDGDGVLDLAVGAPGDDDAQPDEGAVYILFLNPNGTVKAQQKINRVEGGFGGHLTYANRFGEALAPLGDLDGDGVPDLAVGADLAPVGSQEGDVWILFLNTDGTVKNEQHITENVGGLDVPIHFNDLFGGALDALGDLDGDGVTELAVGARGVEEGSVWILFLNTDGTVKHFQEIAEGVGGFDGVLQGNYARFGTAVAAIGDLDGDDVADLAVGASSEDDGGAHRGAVWILFLNTDGTVKGHQKISDTQGEFDGILNDADCFGRALTVVHRLNDDRVVELAVGASGDSDGGSRTGAVWILFLNTDGTVSGHRKISATQGGFTGVLSEDDQFGYSLTTLGDFDGDGVADLVVGARTDDDGPGVNGGALWQLSLDGLAVLDFEREDDHWTPLVNGQGLETPNEFGRCVQIDGGGFGNHGAAIFDSKPDGPNALSLDPDLLVDQGNILILQETGEQSVPGIFDQPGDAQFGGTLTFAFTRPVELRSIDLIDICPGVLIQDVLLVLQDVAGRQRAYLVPGGWTTDVFEIAPPGYGTLDLTTTAPQPGYEAIATSTEQFGFLADAVVHLEVQFSGSGAVNDLVFDPHP